MAGEDRDATGGASDTTGGVRATTRRDSVTTGGFKHLKFKLYKYGITACIIKLEAVLFRQDWID